MKPLAIELFAGTMSGTAGWCELGGRAVGFDLAYEPHHGVPHQAGDSIGNYIREYKNKC